MAAPVLHASLVLLAAAVSVADLRSRLVPDVALLAALAVAVPLCALCEPSGLPVRFSAAAGAGGLLLVAALIRPEGMGLGDAKLAAVLGFYLGTDVVAALLLAFATGSAAGLLLVLRHGWQARSRTIPFAPFLSLGALAAIAPQP
jgi:leader peptidase (prepilin peptidase)/N-methyltransferase